MPIHNYAEINLFYFLFLELKNGQCKEIDFYVKKVN